MRKTILALTAALATGCASTITPVGGTGPSLLPRGTAVAIQSASSSYALPGKLAHIDEDGLTLVTGNAVREFAREDVLALYRRPASRVGVGAVLGGAAGGALGYWFAGQLCDQGKIPGCESGNSDDFFRVAVRVGIGAGMAGLFGVAGQEMDPAAHGLDPSDWREIPWPTRR